MKHVEFPRNVLDRRAVVYVRQSTLAQAEGNLESQRRQYELVHLARSYGFKDIVVIDEDLGRSASGTVARPGFESLVAQLCQGIVGAVLCLEASRLARNGRDWHHLLELCGLVGARVIDVEGSYDPSHPNDRLLLGMKGTMSEFELTLLRRRLVEGAAAKAARGELRISVPVGYVWERDTRPELDPDRRIKDSIRRVFRLFERLGSARQVHRHLCMNNIAFPRPADGRCLHTLRWARPGYRNVIAVLRNPFYAGAYAYGKSETRTTVVDGRVRKSYGHDRPIGEWKILIKDHHEGYIDWSQYERNQERLARNTHCRKAGAPKSGRGGRALLSGLLRCRRCGRMLNVTYVGRREGLVRYVCRTGHVMHGLDKCISFGGTRPDKLVAQLLLEAVQPVAIEAAFVAKKQVEEMQNERRRARELELEQARYSAQLAQRRYEAVDPENRIVAFELETRWNQALEHVRKCESRSEDDTTTQSAVSCEEFLSLAADLEASWNAPAMQMRSKQRLVRTLIEEILVDVDDSTREVILTIHWKGGQHSEHRVRKPRSGEHRKRAPEEVEPLVREMAGRWSDEHIAASLNRLGLKTGQGNTWTVHRLQSYRRKKGIHAYESAHKDGRMLTMRDAARAEGVSDYAIRKLLKSGILPARQVMKDAPWQICADDLSLPDVQRALKAHRSGRKRPCRPRGDNHTLTIPGT
jgi:DNA invertase Pin-like site-specific DNA recombinase